MQLSFHLPERLHRGGARPGAGRKPKPGRRPAAHRPRHLLSRHHPLHIVVRLVPGIPSLRTRKLFGRVHRALAAAKERFGVRIIHYSVQDNHLHLLAEVDWVNKAEAKQALTKAMRGLGVRLAHGVNRVLGRRGRLIEERYHVTRLTKPLQVKNALLYILNNGRKHRAQRGLPNDPTWLDPCATGVYFDHWWVSPTTSVDELDAVARWRSWVRQLDEKLSPRAGPRSIVAPRSWLLKTGWRQYGALPFGAVPGKPQRQQQ